ncbi:hypothetical protein TSOC_011395 [Tetrabaena socialis]|uniref:Uncharacterized protein n=1 Tax=Tetrabaena socialis TaxID=47790 RepID=A0A2J7ZQR6_9CHLO|nr:hypothetical protein TSOC_011395 [Tetrabaena socialis]|eukprot:PNH02614.1 hypothetical protein TSOC_011395 [Tetrabaena socialis]
MQLSPNPVELSLSPPAGSQTGIAEPVLSALLKLLIVDRHIRDRHHREQLMLQQKHQQHQQHGEPGAGKRPRLP